MELSERLDRDAVRFQGNWIPHKLRAAAAGDVFFAGDSAGHCLPLTAEGIRTALYFGIACGRELRRVLDGRADARDGAAEIRELLGPSRLRVPLDAARAAPRPARSAAAAQPRPARDGFQRFLDWSFEHYLKIAHPSFARGERHVAAAAKPACQSGIAAIRVWARLSGNPPATTIRQHEGVLSNEHHRQDHWPGEEDRRRLLDDGGLKRQGAKEERKGEAKEQLDNAQEKVERKAEEVADLERKT